jgi:hypothetical protein
MKEPDGAIAPARRSDTRLLLHGGACPLCLALLAFSNHALATEGGGNSYPIGVETSFVGMMLPEGANPLLYYSHYEASNQKNNPGDNNPQLADFHLRVNTIALRLSYVWPGVRLLGANVETRVVQPAADIDLDLHVKRPNGLAPLDRGGEQGGLCDTAFSPIILGWHSPTYHQTTGIDTHLKLGSYDVNRRVNPGRNYYQVAPFYALTWFPRPGIDVSAKFRYAFNTRNHATHYQSGDEASIEFSAGYRISPRWHVGLNGYLYRQTTDDELNGAGVNGGGNRGRVNSLGPAIAYSFTPSVTFIAKVQSEFGARNRPQGTRLWAQIRIPLQ